MRKSKKIDALEWQLAQTREALERMAADRNRLARKANELEMAVLTHVFDPDEMGEMPR